MSVVEDLQRLRAEENAILSEAEERRLKVEQERRHVEEQVRRYYKSLIDTIVEAKALAAEPYEEKIRLLVREAEGVGIENLPIACADDLAAVVGLAIVKLFEHRSAGNAGKMTVRQVKQQLGLPIDIKELFDTPSAGLDDLAYVDNKAGSYIYKHAPKASDVPILPAISADEIFGHEVVA